MSSLGAARGCARLCQVCARRVGLLALGKFVGGAWACSTLSSLCAARGRARLCLVCARRVGVLDFVTIVLGAWECPTSTPTSSRAGCSRARWACGARERCGLGEGDAGGVRGGGGCGCRVNIRVNSFLRVCYILEAVTTDFSRCVSFLRFWAVGSVLQNPCPTDLRRQVPFITPRNTSCA